MRHDTFILKDHFLPDPASFRAGLVRQKFQTEQGPDGASYTGICLHHRNEELRFKLEELLGRRVRMHVSAFRLSLAGEFATSYVHSDHVCGSQAAVLYLNPPEQCRGGTAFWKHRETGRISMPTAEDAHAVGRDPLEMTVAMEKDWNTLEKWEQHMMVPMVFNRLISYPTKWLHSRYPFEAFGNDVNDGRLIWVAFFDL